MNTRPVLQAWCAERGHGNLVTNKNLQNFIPDANKNDGDRREKMCPQNNDYFCFAELLTNACCLPSYVCSHTAAHNLSDG